MERGVPIRSVSRSIAVLQIINRKGSLSLMEISRAVDLPNPTTVRILQTLIHEGLVECEPDRKHCRATSLVQSLSNGYADGGRLRDAAHPHMVALTKKLSWPVSVTTRVGRCMVVRDSTHTLTSLTFCNHSPGFTLPMLECASGHACLAHVCDSERLDLLAGIEAFERRSEMLELFRDDALVQTIRDDGFATWQRNPHTLFPGKTSSIGVPVFERGEVVATLTLIFFVSAMVMAEAVRRYAGELKAAGAELFRTLSAEVSLPEAAVPA